MFNNIAQLYDIIIISLNNLAIYIVYKFKLYVINNGVCIG